MDYQRFIDEQVGEIKKEVGEGTAINVLSCGVDSWVLTVLAHRGKAKDIFCRQCPDARGGAPGGDQEVTEMGILVRLINSRREFFESP